MYLLKLVVNQQNQQTPTVEYTADETAAKVAYHNTLAAYHNAPDVKQAVVALITDGGAMLKDFTEVVTHPAEDEDDPMANLDRSGNAEE